jgi:hypothetical protein
MYTGHVKLHMRNAFLAEKKLAFIMKLFHFVCEKRLGIRLGPGTSKF